ncbi:uncharacterized protein ARMOST_16381 [Armillaria ostoyae]|uniref:Uncharacterized protein n=1 Tax=Armillaria ostoyae TaxID=47428 RepID=A0A284RW22_ARMOS|nr:uncharacterized protein ARMOST_16381 [Armillaria ostoyae]
MTGHLNKIGQDHERNEMPARRVTDVHIRRRRPTTVRLMTPLSILTSRRDFLYVGVIRDSCRGQRYLTIFTYFALQTHLSDFPKDKAEKEFSSNDVVGPCAGNNTNTPLCPLPNKVLSREMMSPVQWATLGLLSFLGILTYIHDNDRKLKAIPARAAQFTLNRWSPKDVERMASECELAAPSIDDQLPQRPGGATETQRRPQVYQNTRHSYSKTPGSPRRKGKGHANLTKMVVDVALSEPWPDNDEAPILVLNTASNIRFYGRHASLIPSSAKVNIQRAENIIDACRKVGASVLEEPKHLAQVINDDDELIPKAHNQITDIRNDKQK